MPTVVTEQQAKRELPALIARVEHGEEVVIARNGQPVARLVPPARPERPLGTAAGMVEIPPSFFDPLTEEELAEFEDSSLFPENS